MSNVNIPISSRPAPKIKLSYSSPICSTLAMARSDSDLPRGAADFTAPDVTAPEFNAAATRSRHDGWTPERQHDFIQALAESACIAEACGAVGMSPSSAYRLRALPAASAFRQAWDIALDYAIRRLGDAALARALHGVARPVYYKGEQIGERRYFDEKLTMFLLRTRDPVRYGRWLDGMEARRHPDGAGIVLAHALNAVVDAGHGVGDWAGDPPEPARDGDGDDHAARDNPARAWASDTPPAQMPRALDQGPPDAPRPPAPEPPLDDDDDLPEPLRDLLHAIRHQTRVTEETRAAYAADASFADHGPVEAGGPVEDDGRAEDDENADWQAPLTVHRPRRQSKRRTRRKRAVPP